MLWTSVAGGVSGGIGSLVIVTVSMVLAGVDWSTGKVVDSLGASVTSISGALGSSEEVGPVVLISGEVDPECVVVLMSGEVGPECVGVLALRSGVVSMGSVPLPVLLWLYRELLLLWLGVSSGALPKVGNSTLHCDVLQQILIFLFLFSGMHVLLRGVQPLL